MSIVKESPAEALARIQAGASKNDTLVIYAFYGAGVDPDSIIPRENVLTFKAWKAKGRQVAKGAISQRVTVWIPKTDKKTGKENGCFPKTCCLFHESQTIPVDSPKGTKPAAWQNENLVRPGTYEN